MKVESLEITEDDIQCETNNSKTEDDYDPFQHRKVSHPTTDAETLIHLMKGSLGSGILAMPYAFKNAGLIFGLGATCFITIICTYCIHILIKCSQILCKRLKIPSLGFADVAEVAFAAGPEKTRKFSKIAKFMINLFLVIDLLGCCCVYNVFVAKNIHMVFSLFVDGYSWKTFAFALLPFLIALNLVRNLKLLAPFSMVANIFVAVSLGIIMFYVLKHLKPLNSVPAIAPIATMPTFFGTAIFALEGIGVVMPLENNMRNPSHFTGCFSVLTIGMSFVVFLYAFVGFFGYLCFQDSTDANISANMPQDALSLVARLMIALAIFFTYSLQFYVPLNIILKPILHKYPSNPLFTEYVVRITLIILTVIIAASVPNLGPLISLVGALCLSFLGLMFPSIIELVVYWETGLGKFYWMLWKNIFVIAFGVLGLVTGTMVSLNDLLQ